MFSPRIFRTPRTLRGNIDSFTRPTLNGWAVDSDKPARVLMVSVRAGSTSIGKGACSLPRPDLRDAQMSDGRGGFSIPLAVHMLSPGQHQLRLFDVDTESEIATSEFHITVGEVTEARLRLSRTGEFIIEVPARSSATPEAEDVSVKLYIDDSLEYADRVELTPDSTLAIRIPPHHFDGTYHSVLLHIEELDLQARWHGVLARRSTSFASHDIFGVPGWSGPELAARYQSLLQQVRGLLQADDGEGRDAPLARLERTLTALDVLCGQRSDRELSLQPLAPARVSVIIPTYGRHQLTRRCVASLAIAQNTTPFEVVLADDAFADPLAPALAGISGFRLIRNDRNLGFLHTCNTVAASCNTDFIVLLNNDTIVRDGWLDRLIEAFHLHPACGAAGSRLLFPDGRLQEAGGLVFDSGEPSNYGRDDDPARPQYSFSRQSDYVSGAALCIRKSVWDELGGLSDNYAPAYYEDTDLCFRIRAAGYQVWYVPSSVVYHDEGGTHGTDVNQGGKRFQRINAAKFRERWRSALSLMSSWHLGPLAAVLQRYRAHVLFVDYDTPSLSRDAGSYAAIEEMKLFLDLGVHVYFVAEHFVHGGADTEYLQSLGVECLYGPYQTSYPTVFKALSGHLDAVYVTRFDVAERLLPHVPGKLRDRVILNLADLHFLRVSRLGDSEEAEQIKGRELTVARSVRTVLTYSSTEQAILESNGIDPDSIELCPWVQSTRQPADFEQTAGIYFLGNFRHNPNLQAVQWFLSQVWDNSASEHPGVIFSIYGNACPEALRARQTERFIVHGHLSQLTDLQRHRIFLAPLRAGAGVKGKVIEALSMGIPSILSPLAAEGIPVVDGKHCLIARSPQEWTDGIARLHSDRDLWTRMAAAAVEFIRDFYSTERGRDRMRDILARTSIHLP